MSKINLFTTFKNHINITFLILYTLYIHFSGLTEYLSLRMFNVPLNYRKFVIIYLNFFDILI